MTIEFRCSQCSQLLRVPDESVGKNARCPKCQALMQVPAASQTVAPFTPISPLPGAGSPAPSPFGYSTSPPPPKPNAEPSAFQGQAGGGAGPQAPQPQTAYPFKDPGGAPVGVNPYASTPVPQGYGPASQQNPAPMFLAVGSLVTSFMGLLTCACCLFLPFPAISMLLGVIALCIKPDKNARILAIIGIVISALCIILIVVGVLVGAVSATLDPKFQEGFGR